MIGQRFTRLLVVASAGRDKWRKPLWECLCDCGTIRIARGHDLNRGLQKSCGCLRRETTRRIRTTHGMSRSPEFRAWAKLIGRCHTPTDSSFATYGALGIEVCQRWRDSFEDFFADVGPRPSAAYSLDRIDPAGPYSPDNCRWATTAEQSSNRSSSRLLEFEGERVCLSELARRFGLHPTTLANRIKAGWTMFDALHSPADQGRASSGKLDR